MLILLLPAAAAEPPASCSVASLHCLVTAGGKRPGHGRPHKGGVRPVELIGCPKTERICATTLVPVPKVSTRDVVEMAVAGLELEFPRPRTYSAPVTWVRVPTALWVQRSAWRPVRASASAGGQTVVLRGRPTRIRWDLGDGDEVCSSPGSRNGPCFHTWQRSSPTPYEVTATVEYRLTWTCEGRCDRRSGDIGPLPSTGRTTITVHEVQTVTGP
ncbi:hypothetical protein [Actinocorallia longicatena]|uniref:PKD domain-containing protein n=1 Tax=Actinocorallia longicatena TaxID=111803 RepID=A0ABP6Q0V1_9ACTN